MIKMISLKSHVYAGKRLGVGAEFMVRGKGDQKLMKALGRAEDAPAALPPPVVVREVAAAPVEAPRYRTRAVVHETAAEPVAEKPKRQYRRRDLTAED